MDQMLLFIGEISPIMEARLRLSIYEGSTGGRDPYYNAAINNILDSPIIGKQFVLMFSDGTYDYSHNIILDAFMGMGVFGGGTMLFFLWKALVKSYQLINVKDRHFWIVLLMIQQIMSNMVSSAFYYNQLLSVLLAFVFLKYHNSIKKSTEIST